MSNVLLVTVSDDRMGRKNGAYAFTQNKINNIFISNNHFKINKQKHWNWSDILKTEFYKNNKVLLDNIDPAKNGRAYKPFVIYDALMSVDDGDFIIYNDCSPEIWNMDLNFNIKEDYDIDVLKKLCECNNGIITAFVKWDTRNIPDGKLGIHTHHNFTLDRCMNKMGLIEYSKYYMHASGMVILQKTSTAINFVKEWLYWNCIDECCALGYANDTKDYSFWDDEENSKMGCRHDQSISGLLINNIGNKLIDIVYSEINPYNFLNYCKKGYNYSFTNPNQESEMRYIKKGSTVINKNGIELKVFEIIFEDGKEKLIVGLHKESRYITTPEEVKIKL